MTTALFDFTGNAQSSAAFAPRAGKGFNVSLSGTFSATVGLYRQLPGDLTSTWRLVTSYSSPIESAIMDYENGVQYRLTSTAYVSGTASGRLGQNL